MDRDRLVAGSQRRIDTAGLGDAFPERKMTRPRTTLSAVQAVAAGGFALGTVDALFAMVFWVPQGGSVGGIFRSISAGLLGKAARDGGAAVALLGAGLHSLIATAMVLAYTLASRRVPWLLSRPFGHGAIYGVFLYLVMNLVVLPLSAAGMPKFTNVAWVASSVVVHAVLGVIAVFSARLAHARA